MTNMLQVTKNMLKVMTTFARAQGSAGRYRTRLQNRTRTTSTPFSVFRSPRNSTRFGTSSSFFSSSSARDASAEV